MSLYDQITAPPRSAEMPELEFRAAEALFEQVPVVDRHVRGMASFLWEVRGPVREALGPEIRQLPAPGVDPMRVAAVDSAHQALSTAGMTVVFCAGFRTSASNCEDEQFEQATVDSGFEVEPLARLMRHHIESQLLWFEHQGEDQITILDNSFLTLVTAAAQAWALRERCDAGSLSYEILQGWCEAHLGSEGSLALMLRNARVIALPKVGSAQSLISEVYDRIGLDERARIHPAARGQHDRLLLRFALRQGEYLAPRPLSPGSPHNQRWRQFSGDFPGRAEIQRHFIAPADDPERGIDVVYFRPRRAIGAAEGPVMRVELHRPVARNEKALHQILLTLEDSLDGEHPEPVPQLLADHYAKGAIAHAPAAVIEAAYGQMLAERPDDHEYIDLITALLQAQRS
jgi:hypothetical protein